MDTPAKAITPFINPKTHPEKKYNSSHIKTRNTIERLFGAWKRRFPCLGSELRTKMKTTLLSITACAVLWNFIKKTNSEEQDSCDLQENYDSDTEIKDNDIYGNATRTDVVNRYFP